MSSPGLRSSLGFATSRDDANSDMKCWKALSLPRMVLSGSPATVSLKPCQLNINRDNQITVAEMINETKNSVTSANIFLSPQTRSPLRHCRHRLADEEKNTRTDC